MIFPTMSDLSHDEYNRYEIALAAAKCARMITNEYVRQRMEAEHSMTGNKDTDKPLNTMIDREVRDEKAVKIAVNRIYEGQYVLTRKSVEEQEKDEKAILEGLHAADDLADALADATADAAVDPEAEHETDDDVEETADDLVGDEGGEETLDDLPDIDELDNISETVGQEQEETAEEDDLDAPEDVQGQ